MGIFIAMIIASVILLIVDPKFGAFGLAFGIDSVETSERGK